MDKKQLIKNGFINDARTTPSINLDKFNHQNSFGPHHYFDNCGTDWKNYFFNHDALKNIQDDVVFSILDKYSCHVGCKVCYLNGYWENDIKTSPYNEEEILKVFSYFKRANAIDDLVLLKNSYPQLFDFYKKNSPIMEHNITDNGFFSQYKILNDDLNFSKIAYLSFSDVVVNKTIDKIIPMLKEMKTPIVKINFIMTESSPLDNPNIMKLFNWLMENMAVDIYFHTDLCQDIDWVADMKLQYNYDLPSIYYQENSVSPPIVCQILTETIQMRNNNFYSTLTGSTIGKTTPYYTFEHFDIDKFLVNTLKGKIATYRFYRDSIVNKVGNRYFEYFNWVVENVIVNDDFTFVPSVMMNCVSPCYEKLKERYMDLPVGLMRKGGSKVIPIAEVK
jgi:hypothetical protein